jgi:DnaJ-domain-containing protein 1
MHDPASVSRQFRTAFLDSPNQLGFSLVTLLAWVATCDGELAEEEGQFLSKIAAAGDRPIDPSIAIEAARFATAEDLQLACEVVRHMPAEKRGLVLQMAIGIALADGVLRPTENHVLRFLADMLDIGHGGLEKLFHEISGKAFPLPPNLSDPSGRHSREQAGNEGSTNRGGGRSRSNTQTERMRSLAILGLEEGASADEIKIAYRRLAKIHHPDRFQTLGPEAVQASTQTFQRIQSAYEYLRA